jgi:hypothetical protein
MAIGAGIFEEMQARNELARQDQQRRKEEKSHSRNWWKRGVGQGLLGAIPGIVTLNPIQAIAGAAGGFGGESVNHFAFKDKHPEIAGNAAALASLGSGAASKGLFTKAAETAGIGGLEKAGAAMGNSDAYAKEMQLAKMGPGLGGAPELAGPAMPGGAKMGATMAQSGGATHPASGSMDMMSHVDSSAAAASLGMTPEEYAIFKQQQGGFI